MGARLPVDWRSCRRFRCSPPSPSAERAEACDRLSPFLSNRDILSSIFDDDASNMDLAQSFVAIVFTTAPPRRDVSLAHCLRILSFVAIFFLLWSPRPPRVHETLAGYPRTHSFASVPLCQDQICCSFFISPSFHLCLKSVQQKNRSLVK